MKAMILKPLRRGVHSVGMVTASLLWKKVRARLLGLELIELRRLPQEGGC
jgi:hypothetical protein